MLEANDTSQFRNHQEPTLLYFDLRIRKEGFDIEMRVHNS